MHQQTHVQGESPDREKPETDQAHQGSADQGVFVHRSQRGRDVIDQLVDRGSHAADDRVGQCCAERFDHVGRAGGEHHQRHRQRGITQRGHQFLAAAAAGSADSGRQEQHREHRDTQPDRFGVPGKEPLGFEVEVSDLSQAR